MSTTSEGRKCEYCDAQIVVATDAASGGTVYLQQIDRWDVLLPRAAKLGTAWIEHVLLCPRTHQQRRRHLVQQATLEAVGETYDNRKQLRELGWDFTRGLGWRRQCHDNAIDNVKGFVEQQCPGVEVRCVVGQ